MLMDNVPVAQLDRPAVSNGCSLYFDREGQIPGSRCISSIGSSLPMASVGLAMSFQELKPNVCESVCWMESDSS